MLVTHQMQYLSEASRILVMSGGKIQAVGSFDELKSELELSDVDFKSDNGNEEIDDGVSLAKS